MSTMQIRQVAVLGAGVMGAQIAAHLVNARIPVFLFDLPTQGADKSQIARAAIARLPKQSPAPLGLSHDAQHIVAANYEDDLALLGQCDLVIEAIAERLDWKRALYEKIAPHLATHTILASNTSGLSLTSLAAVLPQALVPRFCGVHFFNPPRYMHLLELIALPTTQAILVDALETFMTRTLGKGVVRAKDTPNFIANRVGVFSILAVFAQAEKYQLSYDLVDDLTGSRLGRAKSATFRTADVVGLDVLASVMKTMQEMLLDDPFLPTYATPKVLAELLDQGALGQKAGAGFYRKEGKSIHVWNAEQKAYVESGAQADTLVGRILKRAPAERFSLLRTTTHPQAQFLWAIFRDVFHYIAVHLEAIADNARDIDFALRWGFGWEQGPFELWQSAGWTQVAQWIQEDIAAGLTLSAAPLPAWVLEGPVAQRGGVHQAEGSWSPGAKKFVGRSQLPVYAEQIFPARIHIDTSSVDTAAMAADPRYAGKTVEENEAIRTWVARDDDVLIVSFKSKMNTISPDTLDGLCRAIERAERDHLAVVIWQPTSLKLGVPGGPFSAGANLEVAMPAFMAKGAKGIDPFVEKFQQTMQRVKYAQVPVVGAVSGIALGGGCELLLHCARRVAAFESYIGLVEAGVGLVPAGGGLKEIALRAGLAAQAMDSRNILDFLKSYFQQVAMAKVSSCALEARTMGYLLPSDPIVFNVHALLDIAVREARTLALSAWRPPLPIYKIPVAGRSAIATLKAQLVNLREGKFISEHDALVAEYIARVVCGGDVDAGTMVTEAWLLGLERRAFTDLLATAKTQARIMGMLQTGKPVRN
ncbi:MAG: enoyl-CoA hydratase/isomerase family protein [Ottowia sp.]|nr:enoyl-CoA hydratase/isomerase family protein [Ottowia sp.]